MVDYKILGQVIASGDINNNLYTTPSGINTVCSTLCACAQGASSYIKVAVRPTGQILESRHYIVFNNYVETYDSLFLTTGITLSPSDIVTVSASGGGPVSFSLFGSEIF